MFGISKLKIAFEAHGGWAVFYALLALAAIIGVIHFYRQLAARVERVKLVLLTIIRLAAVALVVLLLFRPVLSFERRISDKPVLLVGLDQSRSMSIADLEGRPSRFQEARNLLLQVGAWEHLSEDFDVRLFAIGQEPKAVDTASRLAELFPDAEATALAPCLEGAAAALGERRPERAMLFSDGQDNSGLAADECLKALGFPVDCVGVGTPLLIENRFKDVALTDVQTRPSAAAEELCEISAFVDAWGFEGDRCEISLWDKGLVDANKGEQPAAEPKEVAREAVVLDGLRGSQETKLRFTPKTPGLHRFGVKAERKPGEKLAENNEAEFLLSVNEPQIKVLYVDVVRGESKFLKNAFARDPHVRLMSLIMVRADVFLQSGDVAGLKLDRIPDSPEIYARFDVVIVGGLSAQLFNAGARAGLKSFVEGGKGVLWLSGDEAFGPGGYATTDLAPLIPIRMGGPDDGYVKVPFQMRLTEEGTRHPVLTGAGGFFLAPGSGVLPSEHLKDLEALNRCLGASPGSGVLAVHPNEKTADGQALPVFVVGQAGRGRCAAFLAGPTWPWLTIQRGIGRESPYHKIWGQTLRWLAGENAKFGAGGEPLQAHMGRAYYRPGETAMLYARALDASGQLTGEAAIEADVTRPDGKTQKLSAAAQGDEAGSYQARWQPEIPGTYKVLVTGKLGDRDLGKRELTFAVGRPNQEFDKLDLNEALLRRVAEKSGGRYVALNDAEMLVHDLKSSERTRHKLTELSLFNLPLFFVAFVTLVTIEWIMRKRNELP